MRSPDCFPLRFLATLFLALGLAACAAPHKIEVAPHKIEAAPQGAEAAPVPATETAGLVAAVPQGAAARALQAAAASYQQASGEGVRVEILPADLYDTQMDVALLAGLERYDLVYLDAEDLARWAGYHALWPLEAPADGASLAPWLAATTVEGKLYGLPVQPDPLVLWYRTDLLAQQGLSVPRDWATFRQAAAALNAPPDHYGAALAGGDLDSGEDFAAVLAGFGARAVSDAYQVQIDSPAAQRALALYAGLRTGDRVVAPGADQAGQTEVIAALRAGQAALGLAPLSAAAQLTACPADGKNAPKVCSGSQPLLAWAWLPGVAETTAVGRVGALAVPLHADRAAAQRFLDWLSTRDGARAWARGGGVPANTAVLGEAWSVENIPGAAALSRINAFQTAFPPVSSVEKLWKASHQAVHAAVSGSAQPAAALQVAAGQMQDALHQGGY